MPALGVVRYAGPPVDLVPGQRLFTFIRCEPRLPDARLPACDGQRVSADLKPLADVM